MGEDGSARWDGRFGFQRIGGHEPGPSHEVFMAIGFRFTITVGRAIESKVCSAERLMAFKEDLSVYNFLEKPNESQANLVASGAVEGGEWAEVCGFCPALVPRRSRYCTC